MNKILPRIFLVGAGGHALSCVDVIRSAAKYDIVGMTSSNPTQVDGAGGYPILGNDDAFPALVESYRNAHVAIGFVRMPDVRRGIFDSLCLSGANMPVLISSHAYVSPLADIGAGSIIMHGAIVNAGAVVGRNCIVNSRSLVEHDARIGDHCHVSTSAVVNGGVEIGEGTFIGSGACIRHGLVIGAGCFIGMGQVLSRDCVSGERVVIPLGETK